MVAAISLVGAAVPSSGAERGQNLTHGDHWRSLNVQQRERTYLVHIPQAIDLEKASPVVLVLHGGGSNAKQWVSFCGMNETADREEFVTVYPNGTGKKIQEYEIYGWNGGPHEPGGVDGDVAKVDDVAFFRALLDDVEKVLNVDTNRVYATGMSMGAIMTYRLASELSDRIAAIAPIAGSMGTEECHPSRPVSVMQFHGTEDPAVPFNGGKGKIDTSGADYLSVDHSIKAWVKADGCDTTPTVEKLPDKKDDGTTVTRTIYSGDREGAEVVLVTINGGGHTWPGRDFGLEMKILGNSSKDISANEMIWDFFKKHPMK